MAAISSRQNPWFKRLRDASREHHLEIALEGPKQVSDAIALGWRPIVVARRQDADAPTLQTDVIEFTPELFDQLAGTRSPQNLIALFERPHTSLANLHREGIVVALDAVQDPGNVGTIIRLAAAFDCAGVAVLPGCADAFAPKAIRASAGAILSVPVVSSTVDELIETGLPLFYADAGGSMQPPPSRGAILVFGSEGSGVSDEIRHRAIAIAIPISARVESLNVAASAAILLSRSFEARH